MLVSGDHYADSRGIPVAVAGAREFIQRALLRLCIKKGSFAHDPELGSELHRLRAYKTSESLERIALGYVREALYPMPEITVESVSLSRSAPDTLNLLTVLSISGQSHNLEVEIK